jgi:VWFA-related protein
MTGIGLSRRFAAASVVVAVAGAMLTGQQPPVFRGGVNFVSVDVYPRRDGKIVEGLQASDFQVFEDGKPQAVATFEYIKTELNPVDSERRDPSSQAEGDLIARDPHNRVFVVYLDLTHTSRVGSLFAQRPVVDFLTRTIGRTDVFGFMTPELPAGQLVFGRRTDAIESQLQSFRGWGQAGEQIFPHNAIEERLTRCAFEWDALIHMYREDLLQTSLENLMTRLGDLRDERKNILFISEGWTPLAPRPALSALRPGGGGQVPRIGVGRSGRLGIDDGLDAAGQSNETQWCNQMIARLASQDFQERFRQLLRRAREANVTFYPVDVGGLKVNGSRQARDTLLTLAENTDGFAIVDTNDLDGGVRRIATDLSSFYLLGYYSTNSAMNGRYREIDVRVKPQGLKVSSRRGYTALTPAALARGVSTSPTVPVAVEAAIGRLTRIRDDADMHVYAVGGPAALDTVVELSSRLLGAMKGTEPTTIRLVATGRNGVRREASASMQAGAKSVRVAIPGALETEGPWRVSARLEAPGGPYEGRTDADTGAVVLAGFPIASRGPASARAPVTPTADLRIRRTERLQVEWSVEKVGATLTVQLLGRNGASLKTTLPDLRSSDDGRTAFLELPMMALPEGEFVIELVAADNGTTERRLLAFRVVR